MVAGGASLCSLTAANLAGQCSDSQFVCRACLPDFMPEEVYREMQQIISLDKHQRQCCLQTTAKKKISVSCVNKLPHLQAQNETQT